MFRQVGRGGGSVPEYEGGKPDERTKGRCSEIPVQKIFQIICSVFDVGVHISMTW